MAHGLDEHAEALAALPPVLRARMEAAWPEAVRVLSPRGLQRFGQSAVALHRLGRGDALVEAWIDVGPQVAREVGEDALEALATCALRLASKTSGAVIERVLATAPIAACRLADADLFGQYLQFLHTLAAQAPRGLRPMLERLQTLLGQLTLGGLRRWAAWGAQAHRTDFAAQVAYFDLQSRESQAMLQQERRGTLLVDVQRRLTMYLRALWGRDFLLRPTAGDVETRAGWRPFIEDGVIHVPDAYDAVEGNEGPVTGLALYRAAVVHAAAHAVHTHQPLSGESLTPWQRAVVATVEDARIEALAVARFPGLRALWAPLHTATSAQGATAGDWLARLARALMDPSCNDEHPWVAWGRSRWVQALAQVLAQPRDNAVSWSLGVELANAYPALVRGPAYHPRTDGPAALYRDDNRYLWAFSAADAARGIGTVAVPPRPQRRHVNLMEFVNELDVETAGDDAQEVWVLGTELFPYEDEGVSYNAREGREPLPAPVHYPEWDHQLQCERPSWTTVQERRAPLGDPGRIDALLTEHRPVVRRMRRLLEALQPHGVQRLRRLEDGDDIDLNAALRALVDIRMGRQPDPRIMMRSVRRTRDLAVLVLLDLSQSTHDAVAGQGHTVLDLTRAACALLAEAIRQVGDPFAVHGFCSDGRHDVRYWRFKDFDQPYDATAKARLAGMQGQLSTRMGAAIRHAAGVLAQRPQQRRLLLVVTDGEPADVDERDPQYLRHDARAAVEAAGRQGVTAFCLSLDPRADAYVSRIFGVNRYQVLDRVERLPEKLPMLYATLTR